MTVTSRWVRYPVAGTTEISSALEGERGIARGTDTVSDVFTVSASANQIRVNLDGIGAQQITLTSGTELDPRFVARDIARKLQVLESLGDAYKYAHFICRCQQMTATFNGWPCICSSEQTITWAFFPLALP